MYKYHKTYHKSSHICECENRSLLPKGRRRGQKSVLTELDWPSPRQSSETAGSTSGRLRQESLCRPAYLRHNPRTRLSPTFQGTRGGFGERTSMEFHGPSGGIPRIYIGGRKHQGIHPSRGDPWRALRAALRSG